MRRVIGFILAGTFVAGSAAAQARPAPVGEFAAGVLFFVPQATYPIEHPALGKLELFIVPLGPKKDGNSYEL